MSAITQEQTTSATSTILRAVAIGALAWLVPISVGLACAVFAPETAWLDDATAAFLFTSMVMVFLPAACPDSEAGFRLFLGTLVYFGVAVGYLAITSMIAHPGTGAVVIGVATVVILALVGMVRLASDR